jgi:hypothetical protein
MRLCCGFKEGLRKTSSFPGFPKFCAAALRTFRLFLTLCLSFPSKLPSMETNRGKMLLRNSRQGDEIFFNRQGPLQIPEASTTFWVWNHRDLDHHWCRTDKIQFGDWSFTLNQCLRYYCFHSDYFHYLVRCAIGEGSQAMQQRLNTVQIKKNGTQSSKR